MHFVYNLPTSFIIAFCLVHVPVYRSLSIKDLIIIMLWEMKFPFQYYFELRATIFPHIASREVHNTSFRHSEYYITTGYVTFNP